MLNEAREVVEILRSKGQTVGTCESLTAGLVAATIADVPGASDVLRGGLVTYASELKTQLADVPSELIDAHGAISAECARAMAEGARLRLGVDWAVALTGVAGPTEQELQPAGTVWLAIVGPGEVNEVIRVLPEGKTRWSLRIGAQTPEQVVDGDRSSIRQSSVEFALMRLCALARA